MPSTIPPAIAISCSHCMCPYFYLSLFIAALLSFSDVMYGGATHPLLPPHPLNQMP